MFRSSITGLLVKCTYCSTSFQRVWSSLRLVWSKHRVHLPDENEPHVNMVHRSRSKALMLGILRRPIQKQIPFSTAAENHVGNILAFVLGHRTQPLSHLFFKNRSQVRFPFLTKPRRSMPPVWSCFRQHTFIAPPPPPPLTQPTLPHHGLVSQQTQGGDCRVVVQRVFFFLLRRGPRADDPLRNPPCPQQSWPRRRTR